MIAITSRIRERKIVRFEKSVGLAIGMCHLEMISARVYSCERECEFESPGARKKAGARTRARYILELCLSSSSAIDKRYCTRTQTLHLSLSIRLSSLVSARLYRTADRCHLVLLPFPRSRNGTPFPLTHSYILTHSFSLSPRSHARTKATESR